MAPRIFWIGPQHERPAAAQGHEMSIAASLKIEERIELDEYGPAMYERRDDAEAVLRILKKRFPEMRNCIVI